MSAPLPGPPKLCTAVVIDYQNAHLTAHNTFDPRGPEWESIIEPMQFSRTAIAYRNKRQRPGYPSASLSRVKVFRGLPHADYDPAQHRRCMHMAANWRQAGADVQLRDLKYEYQRDMPVGQSWMRTGRRSQWVHRGRRAWTFSARSLA